MNKENYFELLGIKENFDIDIKTLDNNLFNLQLEYHPDKMINKSLEARNKAQEKSAIINHAYKILKNPLTRAEHILILHNINIDQEKVPERLLLESMEWREELDEADSLGAINSLLMGIENKEKKSYSTLTDFFTKKLYLEALSVYIELKFYNRFKQEIIKKANIFDETI